ncbi:MAG: hypothetical protein HYY93_02710, partial [Planctomycetes bacterium]|nr:hypothetical protein [Planctomycetota bacterium]
MNDVTFVEVARLSTSLAPLRGPRTVPAAEAPLAPMPLRVARTSDGGFELLDGFKRLRRWIAEGRREVPVVVEEVDGPSMKARLLQANIPPRTASPMDEVRVVRSLAEENKFSPVAVARTLGHKPAWVKRRLSIAHRLAAELAAPLDRGTLSFSLALALSDFPKSEQVRLAEAASRHRLSLAEGKAFLATWRAVPDGALREALLADPRSALPKSPDQGASPLSSDAAAIEARFDAIEKALDAFPEVLPPDLTDPE